MTAYITYMEVNLSSGGVTPKELTETLKRLGWKPIYGRYDYVYEWGTKWGTKDHNIHEYFDHLNETHKSLRNCKVNYSLKTYEQGKENFWTKRGE
jgi:hypothetical protein